MPAALTHPQLADEGEALLKTGISLGGYEMVLMHSGGTDGEGSAGEGRGCL